MAKFFGNKINFMKADYLIVGVDIGGSHITAGFSRYDNYGLRPTVLRRKLNSHGSAKEILDVWLLL